MAAANLPPIPLQAPPLDPATGLFTTAWQNWFQAVKDLIQAPTNGGSLNNVPIQSVTSVTNTAPVAGNSLTFKPPSGSGGGSPGQDEYYITAYGTTDSRTLGVFNHPFPNDANDQGAEVFLEARAYTGGGVLGHAASLDLISGPGASVSSAVLTAVDGVQMTSTGGNITISAGAGKAVGIGPDFYTTTWTDYSLISTIVGWASFTTQKIFYKTLGKLVYVAYQLSGTSNSTSSSFTLPLTATSVPSFAAAIGFAVDNSSALTTNGVALLNGSTSTLNLYPSQALGNWTNSGTKTTSGIFWYEAT